MENVRTRHLDTQSQLANFFAILRIVIFAVTMRARDLYPRMFIFIGGSLGDGIFSFFLTDDIMFHTTFCYVLLLIANHTRHFWSFRNIYHLNELVIL